MEDLSLVKKEVKKFHFCGASTNFVKFPYTCSFHDRNSSSRFFRDCWLNYDFQVISRTHLRFVASFACSQRRCRLPPSPASRRNGSRRLCASSDRRRISAHRGKVVIPPGVRRFSPVTWLKQSRWQATVHPSINSSTHRWPSISLFFFSFFHFNQTCLIFLFHVSLILLS